MKRFILPMAFLISFFATHAKAELFDVSTRILFVESLNINGYYFRNVNVRLDSIDSIEVGTTPIYLNSFDPLTNVLSLNHVKIGDKDHYWIKFRVISAQVLGYQNP